MSSQTNLSSLSHCNFICRSISKESFYEKRQETNPSKYTFYVNTQTSSWQCDVVFNQCFCGSDHTGLQASPHVPLASQPNLKASRKESLIQRDQENYTFPDFYKLAPSVGPKDSLLLRRPISHLTQPVIASSNDLRTA